MHNVTLSLTTNTLLMQVAASDLPFELQRRIIALLQPDDVAVTVKHYRDGWLPNSYRWKCEGVVITHTITRENHTQAAGTYERKRSGGRGPKYAAHAAKAGQKRGRVLLTGE